MYRSIFEKSKMSGFSGTFSSPSVPDGIQIQDPEVTSEGRRPALVNRLPALPKGIRARRTNVGAGNQSGSKDIVIPGGLDRSIIRIASVGMYMLLKMLKPNRLLRRQCPMLSCIYLGRRETILDKVRYIGRQMSAMGKGQIKRKAKMPVLEEALASYTRGGDAGIAVHHILKVEPGRLSDALSRVDAFRKGFNKKSLEKLKEVTGLDLNILASALSVSTKTLQRKQVFDSVQSEKMYELASLYAIGINYFGDQGFRRWMERPLFTIGNRKPIELIDVSEGISILKTEIMRLQHGVAI